MKLASAILCLALLGPALGVAQAQSTSSDGGQPPSGTIAGEQSPPTPGPGISPDESALDQALIELAKIAVARLADLQSHMPDLEDANGPASNSGLSTLFDNILEQRKQLENFVNGVDQYGNKLSITKLKRLAGATGANKALQLRQAQDAARALGARLSALPNYVANVSLIANILDPGAKVMGAAAADDGISVAMQSLSGTCKAFVTAGAAKLGGAAGSTVGIYAASLLGLGAGATTVMSGGTLILGAAAFAGLADLGYEGTVGALFAGLDALVTGIAQQENVRYREFQEQYGDLATMGGVPYSDFLKGFLAGTLKEKDFRIATEMVREKVRRRQAELLAERNRKWDAARPGLIEGLRKLEQSSPALKPAIDKFASGKMNANEKRLFLVDLQRAKASSCSGQLPREVMRDRLTRLTYPQLQKTLQSARISPGRGFYDCLCEYYSIAGNGIRYSPDEGGDCKNADPCKGGNWGCASYDFPETGEAWERCLAANPLHLKNAGKSQTGNAEIRIDEYLAGKDVIQNILAGKEP